MVNFAYPDNNLTGMFTFIQYVNELTTVGGIAWFGVMILIMIYFVAFLSTKNFSSDRAFGFSAFLGMIVAIFLRFLGFINDWILALSIILFIVAFAIILSERSVESYGV